MKNFEQRIENFGAEKIFIAVFLFFGLMILFMRPPYRLMDEPVHFARAWQISEGIFLSPTMTIGDYKNSRDFRAKKIFSLDRAPADALNDKIYVAEFPVSFLPGEFIVNANNRHYIHSFSLEYVKKFLSTPLNADKCEPIQIPNTGVYPPPTYFPQAVAAWLGRTLNLNAGIIFYLMGLSGLIFVAACVYWSMKFLPEAKPLIFLLAMLPMFLIEAASTSTDAVTFGVCFVGTAWLLSLRKSAEKFSRAEIFGLIILSIMLACSKSVYGTILLLYFLIPRQRVGSLKKFLSLGAAILFLNLFVSLVWTEFATAGVELATLRQYGGVESVDIDAQKNFLAEHPTEFFNAMIHTFILSKFYYWFGFIGIWGANGELYMSLLFYELYLIILIFFALTSGLKVKIFERGVLIFVSLIVTTAFFILEYVIWNAVGSNFIRGLQGRYFIPIALMIFAALSILPPMRHKNLIALAAGIFSGINMLLTNFSAFY